MADHPKFFPLSLKLQGRRVVVFGAGRVGLRKVRVLLEHGADVLVVSPHVDPAIREWAEKGRLTLALREYAESDLEDALLVFATTDDAAQNAEIARAARRRGRLVNVATDPDDCDFLTPAHLRRGHFSLVVATDACSPALAGNLRQKLEEEYDAAWGETLELLSEIRQWLQVHVEDGSLRRRRLVELARSELVDVVRRDGLLAARAALLRRLEEETER